MTDLDRLEQIHIIHENDEWTRPLLKELEKLGLPYRDWHLAEGRVSLDELPPPGVFYNRMSASSHTRGHRYAPELTAAVLSWLDSHGCRVINPLAALNLEISKVAQYTRLRQQGIRTPFTVAAVGSETILEASKKFTRPFITKHNRAGKGLGVKLFNSTEELKHHLFDGQEYQPSVDGITLLQQYVQAPTPHITRVEFVGQEFLYAVRVDTSDGFELCPSDHCVLDDDFCPADAKDSQRFVIIPDFDHLLIAQYRMFMRNNNLHVCAFEFITDRQGYHYTYDINTNTNYNSDAENNYGVSAMARLAQYLGDELARSCAQYQDGKTQKIAAL